MMKKLKNASHIVFSHVLSTTSDGSVYFIFLGLVRSAFGQRHCDFFLAIRRLPTLVSYLSDDATVVFTVVTPSNTDTRLCGLLLVAIRLSDLDPQ